MHYIMFTRLIYSAFGFTFIPLWGFLRERNILPNRRFTDAIILCGGYFSFYAVVNLIAGYLEIFEEAEFFWKYRSVVYAVLTVYMTIFSAIIFYHDPARWVEEEQRRQRNGAR